MSIYRNMLKLGGRYTDYESISHGSKTALCRHRIRKLLYTAREEVILGVRKGPPEYLKADRLSTATTDFEKNRSQ